MKFNFNILKQLEQGLEQGITDVVKASEKLAQAQEETIDRPDMFISTEGLTYKPLPPANQAIINTLFQ